MPPAPSFRDPAGVLYVHEDRVFRRVHSSAAPEVRAFLHSGTARKLQHDGVLVRSTEVSPTEVERTPWPSSPGQLVLEHERVEFPSYPYEWPPDMLHAAAGLTLDLAEKLLPEGLGLKDGTPYNVLFRGPNPVFVDLLSVEKRDPNNPIWLPEAQFIRTFLLPLFAYRRLGMTSDVTLAHRDGLEPEQLYRWLPPLSRLVPPALSLVSLPVWLGRWTAPSESHYRGIPAGSPGKAAFILRHTLKRLRRVLNALEPPRQSQSVWSGYMARNSYSAEHIRVKEQFVRDAVREFAPRRVLDIGCNVGHFSSVCAREGAAVVAIDIDPAVAGAAWRSARQEKLPVLPLVVDIAHPTPARGWRNQECPSFLERAAGFFDGAILLAVLHHLAITERVPLDRIVTLAADLISTFAVIEYVGPSDPMFRALLRGRDHLHADFNEASFEAAVRGRFDVVRRRPLENLDRVLYLLRKVR